MRGRTAYLDTSAFVRLLVAERESAALVSELRRWPDRASATLLRTEAIRALRRSGEEHLMGPARRQLAGMHLIGLDEGLLDRAGDLEPAELRSLDAIHLTAALSIGSDLGVFISYDARLSAAARAEGLVVAAPE